MTTHSDFKLYDRFLNTWRHYLNFFLKRLSLDRRLLNWEIERLTACLSARKSYCSHHSCVELSLLEALLWPASTSPPMLGKFNLEVLSKQQ